MNPSPVGLIQTHFISRLTFCTLVLLTSIVANAQLDSILSKTNFELDYRFRAEQDWDSQRPDGTLRDNRSRLRYRLRAGVTYENKYYSFGTRIRTGDPNKQQDPQLTLGKGLQEFGTLPIGFEKAFFQFKKNNFRFWLGKNTYPFEKNNELFWSDNVFPEGIAVEKTFSFESTQVSKFKITAGHFILNSNNSSFSDDAYFQGLQTSIVMLNDRVKVYPSIYLFRNIPNIPDGANTLEIDYSIIHLGSALSILKKQNLKFKIDYYLNFENYSDNNDINSELADQKTGFTIGLRYGTLKEKNDWFVEATYANLQKYSILDYMAQNDWARWDYSAFNSPDGRLSNFQGIELVAAYAITKKINLVTKYYLVEQLIPLGISNETGQRIRFDINIKI